VEFDAFAQRLVKRKELTEAKFHSERAAKAKPGNPELVNLQKQIADSERATSGSPSKKPG
jgi:hypothetical protein